VKPRRTFEHDVALREAFEQIQALRKRLKRLHWISGGRGYENMGKREIEQARNRLDEAAFWLNQASGSLAAGGKRAVAEGYDNESERDR
jgi:hypothetical protein